jgi:hypothetical protein
VPQRDAEQEPHAGHDAVAISYAEVGFDQTQLEPANVSHGADLEIAGHGKEPLGLLWAHGERQLLRLLEMVDLGCQIVPQRNDEANAR